MNNGFITLPIEIYDEKTENPGESHKKNSLAKKLPDRVLHNHSAQQDYGSMLTLVNPIEQISWLCYSTH